LIHCLKKFFLFIIYFSPPFHKKNQQFLAGLLRYKNNKIIYVAFFRDILYKYLEKIKQNKPDLIILDIMMPKMDGLQVCAKLKKDPTMQKIPIIMVTAKAQETDQQWGKECGADSYITKPYQFDALIKQIRELLGI